VISTLKRSQLSKVLLGDSKWIELSYAVQPEPAVWRMPLSLEKDFIGGGAVCNPGR
jgi:hypothetical protein